jgi:hypothetical protein
MSFVVVASVGAGAALGGAYLQSRAAGKAADKQAAAANQATQLQRDMFEIQRRDQQPWRRAGIGALSQMQDPRFKQTFGAENFQADPGYQFRLEQGQKALERSAAARGGLQSGGTLKALTNYSQGAASEEYQNAYNRFNNDQNTQFNRLASLAGIGQTANSQIAGAGSAMAGNVGNIAMNNANAQGAAQIAQGNAWGGALGNLGSQGARTWMDYQMMNKMFPAGGK